MKPHADIRPLKEPRLIDSRSTIDVAAALNRTCARNDATGVNLRLRADERRTIDHGRTVNLCPGAVPYTFRNLRSQRAQTAFSTQTVFNQLAKVLRFIQTVDVTAVEKSLLLGN